MIVRLMRVTVARNTELEVRSAEERDDSRARARGAARGRARDRPAQRAPVAAPARRCAEVEARFAGGAASRSGTTARSR